MRWTVNLVGCPRRVNHAAVAVGDRVYSFGGYCTGGNYRDIKPIDVFVLSTLTYRWVGLEEPETSSAYNEERNWPYQRYGHTVSAYGTDIILFGGRNEEDPCNEVFIFDTFTYTWRRQPTKGVKPPARDGHSSCIIGHHLFIYGGYEENLGRLSCDVYRLNLENFVWEKLLCKGKIPKDRDFHSAVAIGTNMYIFGGRCDEVSGFVLGHLNIRETYPTELSYLDTVNMTWHTADVIGASPGGRRSHSAVQWNGTMIIFGGFNGTCNTHMNDLWQFDPDTLKWKELAPNGKGPTARRRQSVCQVGDRLFLFGGTSPYDGPPLYFTPAQMEFIPNHDLYTTRMLLDHNDMYVLDLRPSLKTLCLLKVIEHLDVWMCLDELPASLRSEIYNMTSPNMVSFQLQTLPLG